MNIEAATHVLRLSLTRHLTSQAVYAQIDPRTNPAQALLVALKGMSVSQDDIAATAAHLGFALNPSTVARIASGDRSKCEDRVKVALCYVYAATLCLLETGEVSNGILYDKAMGVWREMAEAVFLGQMLKAEMAAA